MRVIFLLTKQSSYERVRLTLVDIEEEETETWAFYLIRSSIAPID